MLPVNQDIFYTETTKGDCLQACIASLLELPLEHVPQFIDMPGSWLANLQEFLAKFNLMYYQIPTEWSPNFYHIVVGDSPRGVQHAAIFNGIRLKHDPHPSKAGLNNMIAKYIIVPITLAQKV